MELLVYDQTLSENIFKFTIAMAIFINWAIFCPKRLSCNVKIIKECKIICMYYQLTVIMNMR